MAHSCFLAEHEGYRVLFDPYEPSIGYPAPNIYSVDLIVVSHDHEDHNATHTISGAATVVRGVARRSFGPVTVGGEIGWHGEQGHSDPVSLTLLEWGEFRMAHFGDLGCELDSEKLESFKNLDLLLIPCGGGYTIDGETAASVVKKIGPKVVVPMHYQTPFLDRGRFPNFQSVEPFLKACEQFATVKTERRGTIELNRSQNEGTVVYYLHHQMA